MTEHEDMRGREDDASRMTIMVMATDESVLKMLEMALRVEYMSNVIAFNSSRSILEAAKHIKSDLVIIHHQLLGVNALDLADHLHHIEGRESVPVILTHAPLASAGESCGPARMVLGTPFVLENLYAAVNMFLGHGQ